MTNYCLLVVGVPNLERHCYVAVGAVSPDDHADLGPAAVTLHVYLRARELLADSTLNLIQNCRYNKAVVIFSSHGDGQVFLFFAIIGILDVVAELANQLCAKDLNARVQILSQMSLCNSLQALIILLQATCLCH